jgi:hypothetical protein
VDWQGNTGQYPGIALDAGGNPHILHYDAGNRDLRHTWRVP